MFAEDMRSLSCVSRIIPGSVSDDVEVLFWQGCAICFWSVFFWGEKYSLIRVESSFSFFTACIMVLSGNCSTFWGGWGGKGVKSKNV